MKRSTDVAALIMFILSVTAMVFTYGMAVGRYEIFPYGWIVALKRSASPKVDEYHAPGSRPHHLSPAWYDYSGARTHDAGSMAPGVTLLTGYWATLGWKPGIRLIDSSGNLLHEWKTDPAEIWKTSPHKDRAAGSKNKSENYVHGAVLLDNGDVVFNIEYMGLVRMDASGNVIWRLPYRTHHSVSRDHAGNFWVCGLKWIEDTPDGRERLSRYPGLEFPAAEEFALEVSGDGKILREISILKAIYDSGYQKLIWQMKAKRIRDILHANDVEVLSPEMASQYPLFAAGDVMVSCRYVNAVFVIDGKTERIKWISTDFLYQHDPDFGADGRILVFDNNFDGSERGSSLGGSCIVALTPGIDTMEVLYPKNSRDNFYTEHGGKVQRLNNGNLLITEARRGRVFEVKESGETVWEWVADQYDEESVPEVLEGSRYALSLEQIAKWSDK